MHLWTEYVGNTVAGYPLDRLSRSEGRSAFFVTTAEGQAALLRLTEAHFDDGELIGRWQKIAGVSHPGLQGLRRSGRTTFDGVALAFCQLEPTDASLSEVLRERVLTADEAAEVAKAVAGALAALHDAGLVHGHVDAINVFAVGEAVKLRSDCARECTGDFEADTSEAREALRQRDVHDLGLLLRRCLTPQWQESAAMQLPSPFDRIVRRALNGSVSAAGIVEEMVGLKPAPAGISRTVVPVASRQVVPVEPRPVVPVVGAAARAARVAAAALPRKDEVVAPRRTNVARYTPGVRASVSAESAENSPAAVSARLADRAEANVGTGYGSMPARPASAAEPFISSMRAEQNRGSQEIRLNRVRNRLRHNTGTASVGGVFETVGPLMAELAKRKVWVASGVAAAVLGFVLWNTSSGAHPAAAARVATPNQSVAAAGPQAPAAGEATVAAPLAQASTSAKPARSSLLTSGEQAGWHVIAYTFKYEKQAETKTTQLKERYLALHPQVYSPTGRAPFFVALGGPSDSVSAIALRNRARRAGLPRDTYARNF